MKIYGIQNLGRCSPELDIVFNIILLVTKQYFFSNLIYQSNNIFISLFIMALNCIKNYKGYGKVKKENCLKA